MPAPVNVRIIYRGPGSLQQPGVAPPRPELIQTVHAGYDVGDEIVRVQPGWFVHEMTLDGGVLTWIVELRRPGWDLQEPAAGGPDSIEADY